ncbi:hypothetical protein ACS0TY_026936 [Phlomoides rotata]
MTYSRSTAPFGSFATERIKIQWASLIVFHCLLGLIARAPIHSDMWNKGCTIGDLESSEQSKLLMHKPPM